ncbi:MAG: Fe-S protein assembly chaperone HscA [Phycisphaerales bacterium]|nr:Fe-S protein assembly chaperone HscA [Planctomycetota bacterium]MCH8508867.1 Fe-S protein assembly chaperone HscA [Phycisphaerales bacterium]
MTPPEPILGIDLGTTNSLVAIADERGPRVLTGGDADPILPSAVRYDPDAVTVGRTALDEAPLHPRTTVTSVKRLMGRSLEDVRPDLDYLAYEVVEGPNNTARVRLPDGRTLTPEQVSAEVLKELKRRAEAELGRPVRKAVVTVPAYFDDAQRQATRHAGRIAGLEVVRIVNEPTAAALAYGLGTERAAERNAGPRTVAVYDLGGGTFDVSILRLTPGGGGGGGGPDATDFFQVLATAGDTRLGGDDIDHAIVALLAGEIGLELGRGPDALASLPLETRRALLSFARAVKHRLSDADAAPVEIDLGDGQVYRRTLTRDELETIAAPLVARSLKACERAMRDASRAMKGEPVDTVILVGGSTRIPLVRSKVGAFFGVEPYAALDPDRVVALGAAVQASILSGARKGSLLLDVIPLSLGVETVGGAVAKLIVRNSPVPARAMERFSTSVDGQTNVKLNILQGEREMAQDCRSLGAFELRGIPPMPAGIPKLEVTFLVDANGVLSVSAVEQRSGKRAGIQIVPNHGLTEDEVERMEAESLTHARDDMQQHRVVDLITNSKLDLKWIGERFDRYADRLDDAERAALESSIAALRAFVEQAETDWRAVDANAFYQAKNELDQASIRLQEVGIAASLREDADRGG